jgi:hypothetical protein
MDGFAHHSAWPQAIDHLVVGEGGSAAVTKRVGPGVDLTRLGAGSYRITWDQNPGVFLGAVASLQAATPGDLAGHVVVFDTYDAANRRLDFTLYAVAAAAADVPAYTTGEVVAAHTAVLGAAGRVILVEGTAGDQAGVKTIQSTAAPGEGAVQVEYTAGVATLTFNATDNISEATVLVDAVASVAAPAAHDLAADEFVAVIARFEGA